MPDNNTAYLEKRLRFKKPTRQGDYRESPYQPSSLQTAELIKYNASDEGIKNPVDPRIVERGLSPDVAKKVQEAIDKISDMEHKSDIQSINNASDKRLEVDVALFFGPALTGFNRITQNPAGEIDVETDHFMVEATSGKKGKAKQMAKYSEINANEGGNKKRILFAPNYRTRKACQEVEETGATIARNFAELGHIVKKTLKP